MGVRNIVASVVRRRGLSPCWTPETGWIDFPEGTTLILPTTEPGLTSQDLDDADEWDRTHPHGFSADDPWLLGSP